MITELNVEHLALLIALERHAQSGTSDAQMLAALGSQDSCVLGWWQDELLLGYAIVARLPFEAELQAIGVHPEQRRSGAGRALMDAVLATARGWLSERLLLEVRVGNLSAIRLYQRCGFSEDGRRKGYYPPQGSLSATPQGAVGREDALLMSQLL
ncbi:MULTISPECIES: GNAT family N-acetyltransferase [unclassified Halomonas]|uniref:GNAT family N-acetyltransferase n=1 Tax=unclassified Halomonas TaxID=2609666 RepID=UPI0007D92650|nr:MULTISPECIES: GNAT family N-acetyltransferase [unclassified Halomonas]MBT2786951.1 GNAT family N-acetyltransferase [Halomonas sp. ISL-106]MBT2798396.1 GNAT family N-acetyltransferase [Halomonas sp. ISL-104]OAL58224.1 ribosomal-protein-alanine acetyltransferase [Halomonas sp. ALS9]